MTEIKNPEDEALKGEELLAELFFSPDQAPMELQSVWSMMCEVCVRRGETKSLLIAMKHSFMFPQHPQMHIKGRPPSRKAM